MGQSDAIDEIGFLAGSRARVQLLSELDASVVTRKRELRERFDVSRTTLKRNLDALVERGWVTEERGSEYRLTASGQMVREKLEELVGTVEATLDLQPFLRWVDPSEFDLNPALLAGADVTVAKGTNPYAPMDEHVAALEQTDSFRGCLPAVGRDALRQCRDRLGETDGPWELVVTPEVLETLRSDPNINGEFEAIREHDGLDIYVHEGEIPMFVGLFDEVVQIGVEDDNGVPQALVSATDDRVREWAREFYEGCKGEAEFWRSG